MACSGDGARSGQARRVVALDLYTLIARDGPTTPGRFAARRRPRPLLDSASRTTRGGFTLSKLIRQLHIQGYRAFGDLKIEGLGRVNLITGRNGSGKTSVLEAVRLLVSSGAPKVWLSILRERNEWEFESPTEFINEPGLPTEERPFPTVERNLSRLFSHQPEVGRHREFRITSDGVYDDLAFELNLPTGVVEDELPSRVREPQTDSSLLDSLGNLTVRLGGARSYAVSLDDLRRVKFPPAGVPSPQQPSPDDAVFLPARGWTSGLIQSRWEKVALRPAEGELVRALRIVLPELHAVSVLSAGPYGTNRAVARLDGSPDRTPLASLGDGALRLFELGLALVSTEANVILMDEVENGLHYSVHEQFWRLVFELAAQRDLQVFAVTHSFDCIRGFQAAASAHSEEGSLVRLQVFEGVHYATTFREDDLALVTERSIEVR